MNSWVQDQKDHVMLFLVYIHVRNMVHGMSSLFLLCSSLVLHFLLCLAFRAASAQNQHINQACKRLLSLGAMRAVLVALGSICMRGISAL